MERLIYEFFEHEKRMKLAPSTVRDREKTLMVFLDFIKTEYPEVQDITDITRDIVRGYEIYIAARHDARGKNMTRTRRRKYLSDVKAFFLYLQKVEKIYTDPSTGVALPKFREQVIKDVLTIEEMDKLLINCTGHSLISIRDRTILELLYSTGIRAMEICTLELERCRS